MVLRFVCKVRINLHFEIFWQSRDGCLGKIGVFPCDLLGSGPQVVLRFVMMGYRLPFPQLVALVSELFDTEKGGRDAIHKFKIKRSRGEGIGAIFQFHFQNRKITSIELVRE